MPVTAGVQDCFYTRRPGYGAVCTSRHNVMNALFHYLELVSQEFPFFIQDWVSVGATVTYNFQKFLWMAGCLLVDIYFLSFISQQGTSECSPALTWTSLLLHFQVDLKCVTAIIWLKQQLDYVETAHEYSPLI